MSNLTPTMILLVQNMIAQGESAENILSKLDEIGLILKPIDPSTLGKTDWVVRFSKGGRVYTYSDKTIEDMSKTFTESLSTRGELPYSIYAWIDESWRRVSASA